MIKIKNLKIINLGNSKAIIIPAHFFEHGDVKEDMIYDVEMTEKKEE